MVLAVEYFRQFLYGTELKVITDHKPLKYMFTVKEPASRLLRWLNRLNMYSYSIEYRKGTQNGNADGLSRLPTEIDENEDEISDETIIINVIVTEPETLNEQQMKDENLFWVYTLKIEAMKRNEHKIIIEPKDLQIKNKEASTDNGIAFL